jgi:NADP-dependent 3-hydroxy acid dehydrogenase YdfG
LARAYAREGWHLVLFARRRDRLADLAGELPARCHVAVADVSRQDEIEVAIREIPAAFREVDVLVNNAGITVGEGPIHQRSIDDWNRMVDTNIRGMLQCTRVILPRMVERGRGHIVNIGSTAGSYPRPGNPVYCASKAFSKQFSLALRADLQGLGVRVTSVEPGTVQGTELALQRVGGDRSRMSEIYSGYEYLTPEDIARAVVWCTGAPEHMNVNRLELMATCQTFSNLSSTRSPVARAG